MPSVARAYGGPTSALLGFLAASASAGVAAEVAAPDCSRDDAMAFRAASSGFPLATFAVSGPGVLAFSRPLERWMSENASRFDVVHVHGLLNLVSSRGARAALRMRRPLVVCPFGTLSRYTSTYRRRAMKRAFFSLLEYPNLRRADAVHFTSPAERDEADWHGLGLGERAHVVPPPLLSMPTGSVDARVKRSSAPVVLFLSRLHPVKGLETLLDAWPLVRRAIPDARLVIAGEGERDYSASLAARAAAQGGEQAGISFVGFVTAGTKSALWEQAAVFVLPSQHENFGMVVLEALGAGVPVIVSPDVQLQSFVAAQRLGVVVEREATLIAQAIIDVLGNASLRTRVAEEAPAIVAREFAPRAVGRQLVEMYDSAIARSSIREHLLN